MRGRDQRGDRGDLARRAERREDLHSSVTPPREDHPEGNPAPLGDLPAALRAQSLTEGAIILPLDAALQAIEHFAGAGHAVQSWEGWVKLRDGGRTRSLEHAGSFALPREPARAAAAASEGMRRAAARWDRDPEYPGAALYFSLAFAPVT